MSECCEHFFHLSVRFKMKYSTDLYDLIRSLSQAEKRYVKLFAQAFTSKGTENQLALFDAFARQSEYDEELIRREFAGRIAAQNFHVAKNRLYHLILRALYLFHSSQSEKEKINQHLFQADILRKRGLYKQAEDLLEKSLEAAMTLESNIHIPQAHSLLGKVMMQRRDIVSIRTYLDRNLADEKSALQRYNDELGFQYLELQLLHMTYKMPTARTPEQLHSIVAMRNHPLLQSEEVARNTSKRALWIYRFVNGFIYRYEGNYRKAAEFWDGFTEELQDTKAVASRPMDFIADLNNLMFLQMEAKLYNKARSTSEKLAGLMEHEHIEQDLYLLMKIRERLLEFQLSWFCKTHRYDEGLQYWEEQMVQEWENSWRGQVGEFRRLSIEYAVACLYLANGKPQQASEWLERLWSNRVLKDHEYLYSSAMIMNLIIHFEMGNLQLLDSLALNTYRMLYKRKLLYGTERIIFKYLRRYLRAISASELMESFRDLQRELKEIGNDQFENVLLDNFDLSVWIESKIGKDSMNGVARLQHLRWEKDDDDTGMAAAK